MICDFCNWSGEECEADFRIIVDRLTINVCPSCGEDLENEAEMIEALTWHPLDEMPDRWF